MQCKRLFDKRRIIHIYNRMSAAERVYDRSSFCTDKLCRQTREQIVASGCAATCSLKPPSAPVRGESVITCASTHMKTLLSFIKCFFSWHCAIQLLLLLLLLLLMLLLILKMLLLDCHHLAHQPQSSYPPLFHLLPLSSPFLLLCHHQRRYHCPEPSALIEIVISVKLSL